MMLFDISHLHVKTLAPGLNGRFIRTKNVSVAFWNMARHTTIPSRKYEFETLIIPLEGKLSLTINHETCEINPGMGILIPPHTEHSICTIGDCRGVDIITPVSSFCYP